MIGRARDAPRAKASAPVGLGGNVRAEPYDDATSSGSLLRRAHWTIGGTYSESHCDRGLAVTCVGAADNHRRCRTVQRTTAHHKLTVTRRARLKGVRNVRVFGDIECRFACTGAASDGAITIFTTVSHSDPVLGPIPCSQEVIGMLSAFGSSIFKCNGMRAARYKLGKPQALHSCIAFKIERVIALQIAIDPAAAGVAGCITCSKIVGTLVVGAD